QHKDRWLEDLLRTRPSPSMNLAVAALGRAVKADLAGNPSEAEREALTAEKLFRAAGSAPGALRARLEGIYALHRSFEAQRCLDMSSPLAKELRGRNYTWVNGQLLIEQSNCWGMLGDFGRALGAVRPALAITKENALGTLHLRGLGLAAGLAGHLGNALEAWSRNRAGLAAYWSGSFPGARGYQF